MFNGPPWLPALVMPWHEWALVGLIGAVALIAALRWLWDQFLKGMD